MEFPGTTFAYPYRAWFFGYSVADFNLDLVDPQIDDSPYANDAIFYARSTGLTSGWQVYCGKDANGNNVWDTTMDPSLWRPVIHRSAYQNTLSYDSEVAGDPAVVYYMGTFYMAYSASGRKIVGNDTYFIACIMGATSTNGIDWVKSPAPILEWPLERTISLPAVRPAGYWTPANYYGAYHRPSLMLDEGKWKMWFDYFTPDATKWLCLGYAENTVIADFLNGNLTTPPAGQTKWQVLYADTNWLMENWPNPSVVKIDNAYYAFCDASNQSDPGSAANPGTHLGGDGRITVVAQSPDGINWTKTGFMLPDGLDCANVGEAFVHTEAGQVWLYLFYAWKLRTTFPKPDDWNQYKKIKYTRKLIGSSFSSSSSSAAAVSSSSSAAVSSSSSSIISSSSSAAVLSSSSTAVSSSSTAAVSSSSSEVWIQAVCCTDEECTDMSFTSNNYANAETACSDIAGGRLVLNATCDQNPCGRDITFAAIDGGHAGAIAYELDPVNYPDQIGVGPLTVGTTGEPSYYGTYDQEGNVSELIEDSISSLVSRHQRDPSAPPLFDGLVNAAANPFANPYDSNYGSIRFAVGGNVWSPKFLSDDVGVLFNQRPDVTIAFRPTHSVNMRDVSIFDNLCSFRTVRLSPPSTAEQNKWVRVSDINNPPDLRKYFSLVDASQGEWWNGQGAISERYYVFFRSHTRSFFDTSNLPIGVIPKFGSVAYEYWIRKTTLTQLEFANYLNIVDPNAQHAVSMRYCSTANYVNSITGVLEKQPYFGNHLMFDPARPVGSRYYLNSPNCANKPVMKINWLHAARYCNWVTNGSQANSNTESGAYQIINETPTQNITRSNANVCAIPTWNEWYKAAYYNPLQNKYFTFATQSDRFPQSCGVNRTGDGLPQIKSQLIYVHFPRT